MASVHLEELSGLITQKLEDMVEAADPDPIQHKRKAISVLFPYALILEQHKQREMLKAVSRAAIVSDSGAFMWHHIKPFIVSRETKGDVVCQVRALGDIGVLKSYLLLLWSEWYHIDYWSGGLAEMRASIREDFGGIGMGHHRGDLIEQLDYFLEQLNSRWVIYAAIIEGPVNTIQSTKELYEELKRLLLEVDGEAMKTLYRMPLWLICFGLLTPVDIYRVSLNLHVLSTSPVPIATYLGSLVVCKDP